MGLWPSYSGRSQSRPSSEHSWVVTSQVDSLLSQMTLKVNNYIVSNLVNLTNHVAFRPDLVKLRMAPDLIEGVFSGPFPYGNLTFA